MNFKQVTIKQPQTHQLILKFEVSGVTNCYECEQLVESYAEVLQEQILLGNTHLKISYSINSCSCGAKRSHSDVQLPRF
ncbi:MAG: hypothetical protein N4J56_007393 [Chroococcidiopsis sp. SAG 2025]|nr:hypothetical protein [Chroococcidiopsis sp. SAG 2025]